MRFQILGPLEAYDGDRRLPLGGAKQRGLLGMLLLHANEVVSSDRLIDALWGEAGRGDGTKALSVTVSRLRKVLDPDRQRGEAARVLVTRAPGYELRIDSDQLDLHRFERLVAESRAAADPATAAELLRNALELWRGPALADLAYELFAQTEIARLEEARLVALELRIDADLALGRHDELIGELESLTAEHQLRERFRGQLMLALYRSGRRAEALETYQSARTALVEELGIEPGRRLRELHQAILQEDPALDLEEVRAELSSGAFVGRRGELAELLAGLEEALARSGRLFLIAGEPGIGKSRLAEELATHARARGALVLVGRCWEAGDAPAYWPWTQALRAYLRENDADPVITQLGPAASELIQILPGLRGRFPDLPAPSSTDPEGARFRLFEAVAEFLRAASERRPILLGLDDLHAADGPSLLLLRFVTRELGTSRVLVLGAYRTVDPLPEEPLAEMLAEVAREPGTRRLALGGLSEPEVEEYLKLTASGMASARLASAVHGQTEGNPLFVGEIVRLLSVEGAPEGSAAEEPRVTIPQSVRDVIARRLTHLPEESRRLLVLASMLGREFDLDVLARVGGVSDEELLEWLDEAIAARLVAEVPGSPGRLRFAHQLIRDTLDDGLTSARRVRLHKCVVEALEQLDAERPGTQLAELARHSIAAGDHAAGARYARRAADRALELLAYEESARLYRLALEALDRGPPVDPASRCELLLAAGDALHKAGSPESRESFLAACDLARTARLPELLARGALGYGGSPGWRRAAGDTLVVGCARRRWRSWATTTRSSGPGCSRVWRGPFETSRSSNRGRPLAGRPSRSRDGSATRRRSPTR
jgi:DNA-binding SARP family transcriptional activator